MAELTTLWTGLVMGESARWHDGRFWCSDWAAGELLTATADGGREVVARSSSLPFCFDWTGDGTMLVTSSTGLERLEGGELAPHVDLSHLSSFGWNEPVVHPSGNVYVNSINFDMMGADGMDFEKGSAAGLVAVVTPDGGSRVVATQVAFPNGMAVTADGSTLLVAESFASRIGAWDVEPDGSLSNRRIWAADVPADGVSLDAEGALWVASQDGAWRVREGGEVTDRIHTDRPVFSCALGGEDGRTLFLVCNEWTGVEGVGEGRTGVVYTTRVAVPAAV
ncbi:MAG TPA: SMP-30/gluconolactonase/LRE family protein [Acidimicrobiales bacterium]|nr:SMP-30/gluconolactonase/LRE family protein [Acidimicrobiales bacterium]